MPHLEKYWDTGTFLTEALTLEAKRAIDESLSMERPFFLYFSHYALHAPFQADPRFLKNYDPKGKSKDALAFATLVEGMDRSLGDVMDFLEKRGIAENTIILFLGDNGSDSPFGGSNNIGSSAPLRGKKGAKWEGGIRVPFIAAWAKPNAENRFQKRFPIGRNMVHPSWGTCYDLFPTVAAITGASIPKDWKVDGVNLLPALASRDYAMPKRFFLSHFPHSHRSNYFSTLREGHWKIVRQYDPQKQLSGGKTVDQLYNIIADISESNNLAEKNPKQLEHMQKLLDEALREHGALLPRPPTQEELDEQRLKAERRRRQQAARRKAAK